MYPTPAQEQVMVTHCDHARKVWNLALEQHEMVRPSTFGCYADHKLWTRQLTELRKAVPWLADGSSWVQQDALRDLQQAFRNWWTNPAHFGPPKWRSLHKGNQGFVIRRGRIQRLNRKWAEVTVPKAGRVRFRWTRPIDEHGRARVTLDRSGRWHVSFSSPQTPVEREQTGATVGIDRGVIDSIATSDGLLSSPAGLTTKELRRKKRLQRKLARQVKDSKHREVTKRAIAKLAARETDRRKDWVEKISTDLVRDYDLIAFEDLKVRNMMASASGTIDMPGSKVAQKRGLNRGIAAQGWTMLLQRTEAKASASSGCQVVTVPARHTSQRCSACGHVDPSNRHGKWFMCSECDHAGDADVNAATNIRDIAAGLAVDGRGRTAQSRPPSEASTSAVAART